MPRDIGANVHRIRTLLAQHCDVDIAVFPELFVTGYEVDRLDELAVSVESTEVAAIQGACAEFATAFVGGYVERGPSARPHNSLLIIDADGDVVGNYRKTHLFGVENSLFEPGHELGCVQVGSVRVGPMICFDVEIAEVARTLALEKPDLFIAVAANMDPYLDDHLIATRARALDNRTPMVYVNRVGSEAGFDFVGGSRVLDGDGQVTFDLGPREQVAVVDVRLKQNTPDAIDYLRHLRPELYGLKSDHIETR